MKLDEIFLQCQNIQNQANDTQYNLIILGPTGSGKSTIANCLSKENDLIFQKQLESGCFLPLKANKFNISKDFTQSMTLIPQRFQINQNLTLWDIPGFGDNRSIEIDVQTTLLSSALLNQCEKSLILLLIPQKQFIQDKAQKLVEILNMILNKNTKIILIISKAEQKLTSKYIKEFLIKLIEIQKQNQKMTRLTECSAYLLEQIINQDLIRIFRQPKQSDVDGQFEFCKKNINEIEQLIYNDNLFATQEFILQFSSQSQNYMENLQLQIQTKLEDYETILQREFTKLNIIQLKQQSDIIKKNYQELKIQYDLHYQEYLGSITKYDRISTTLKSQQYNCTKFKNSIQTIENFIIQNDSYVKKQELYISGLTYSSTQLMDQMIEYTQQQVLIQVIHINSILSFVMNGDIILPGVTIHITTLEFIVLLPSIINLKGKDGQQHQKAQIIENILPISQNGNQGQNGGSLYIKANQYHSIDLLTINLSGGNGGDGQDGADGKDGQRGKDGDKEKVITLQKECYRGINQIKSTISQEFLTFNTRFHQKYISRGSNGEQGGDSSEGGIGGEKGIQGMIKTNCLYDINFLNKDSQKGNRGKDGKVGIGGQRGRDFVGIYQVIKPFAIFNKPIQPQQSDKDENFEQIQDDQNITTDQNKILAAQGVALSAISISYTNAATSAAAKATQQLTEEMSKAALKQVAKKAVQQAAKQAAQQQFAGEIGKQITKKALEEVGGQMAKKATSQIIKRVGTQVAKKVGQEVTKQTTEQIGKQIGTVVARQVGKQIAKKAAKQVAEKVAQETVKKLGQETVKKLGQETVKKLGQETVKKMGQETVKKMGKELTTKLVTQTVSAGAKFSTQVVNFGVSLAYTAIVQGIISAGDCYFYDGIWIEKDYQENQDFACSGKLIENVQLQKISEFQNLFQQENVDDEQNDDDQKEIVEYNYLHQEQERLFEKSIKKQEKFVAEENYNIKNHIIKDLDKLILVQ